MDSDDIFLAWVWGVCGIVTIALALTIAFAVNYNVHLYTSNGYCQEMGVGYATPLWVKCK